MAVINFLPTCSECGSVLYTHIDCSYLDDYTCVDFSPIMGRYWSIEPYKCPYCNSVFEQIKMPIRLPFDNTRNFLAKKE